MDIMQAIAQRISIRTYQSIPASITDLDDVRLSGEHAKTLSQTEMQFRLCTEAQMSEEVTGIIGNYGRTIKAPYYIVLAARESPSYLIDAGFRFEQMVLNATQKGLGTCCVGLMFKEDSLRKNLGLDASWRIVLLTPIGLVAKPSFVSQTIRIIGQSAGRKPINQLFFWQSHGSELLTNLLSNERFFKVLEATRRAPSWMNIQPWRFIITDKEILSYKVKSNNRDGKDYHFVDCGIAMSHLHLAAKAEGFEGHWELCNFKIPGADDAVPIGRYHFKKPLSSDIALK